jgi:hypothetical protein
MKNIVAALSIFSFSVLAHADPSRLFCVVETTTGNQENTGENLMIVVDKTTEEGATDEAVGLTGVGQVVTVSQGHNAIAFIVRYGETTYSSMFVDLALASFTKGNITQTLACEVLNPDEEPTLTQP